MRPRIRSIKPEIWADEAVGGVSRDARLLFVGLITLADDAGRLRVAPAALLGRLFPYDENLSPAKIRRWLDELEDHGLVMLYQDDGNSYLWLVGWRANQKINRPSPSKLPPPPHPDGSWWPHDGNPPPDLLNGKPTEAPEGYRKAAIPEKVRREVARRYGCPPGETIDAACHYCGAAGQIAWRRLESGKPGSWVTFPGLHLDHVHPEAAGGQSVADNIVLACGECNRRKGARIYPFNQEPAA